MFLYMIDWLIDWLYIYKNICWRPQNLSLVSMTSKLTFPIDWNVPRREVNNNQTIKYREVFIVFYKENWLLWIYSKNYPISVAFNAYCM